MTNKLREVSEIVNELVERFGQKECDNYHIDAETTDVTKWLTQTLTADRQRCEEMVEVAEYTDTTDKNYPNYQTYYGAVTNNPLFQMWRDVAEQHGIDVEESVETGWMSDMHFAKFLEWVVNRESLEQFFILAYPDLREITFHSNGDVIIKTGANATRPKKLYSGKPPRNADGSLKEQPDWSNQIKVAIHKLLSDKETQPPNPLTNDKTK